MAERRMFAKTIIDSDAFLDMPHSTQLLYFHLCMRADDDGFINNPKSIMRNVKCNDDDMKLLMAKKFIIPFDSGIVVIKHWKIHNYIAKDRYTETKYLEEKAMLSLDKNKVYTECIQPVYNLDTQVSIGKDSIGKDSIGKDSIEESEGIASNPIAPAQKKPTKHKYGEYNHVLLTDDEYQKLVDEYGDFETHDAIKYLDEYIEMKGAKYKSHYLAMRKWVYDAVKQHSPQNKKKSIDWDNV